MMVDNNSKDHHHHYDFEMNDLVLDRVLSFAIDEHNCLNYLRVCKRWKQAAENIAPPSILTMVNLTNMETENIPVEKTKLLTVALLKDLDIGASPLRGTSPKESISHGPRMAPRFRAIVMTFIDRMCTQKKACCMELFKATTDALEGWAEMTVDALWSEVKSVQENNYNTWEQVLPTLGGLVKIWRHWEGAVSIISGVCWYLERYAQGQDNPTTFSTKGKLALANVLSQKLLNEAKAGDPGQVLEPLKAFLLGTAESKESFMERALALVASLACENLNNFASHADEAPGLVLPNTLSSLFTESLHNQVVPHLAAWLKASQEEKAVQDSRQQERIATGLAERPVFIKAYPSKERIVISPEFIQTSNFLRNLGLQGGDTLPLVVDTAVLTKAKDFYELCSQEGFSKIPYPLPLTRFSDLVNEEFVNFRKSMDQRFSCKVLTFATLLGLEDLINFLATSVALMLQGMSNNQLRDLFNVQD